MRKRPGMYVGDLGRIGCLRVIATATELLIKLAIGKETGEREPHFSWHAFLDVSVSERVVIVVIDFHNEDAQNIAANALEVAAKFNKREIDWNEDQDVAYVIGLTENPQISALIEGERLPPFPADTANLTDAPKRLQKGSYVGIEFRLIDELDPSSITFDFLEGFLAGRTFCGGLVLRDLSAK